MARDIPSFSGGSRGSFWKVVAAFLGGGALPFARVLSAKRIEQVFAKHGGLFGGYGIYSAAMMVWSFLGQVLRDGKEASCQAAVARVVSYREHEQIAPPTADTGDDCRALREALRSGAAGTQLRGGRRDGSGRRNGLVVEGQTCQADRRLHVYDARHGEASGRVSPAEVAEARGGAADRPGGDDPLAGDRLRDGCGAGPLRRQTNGRAGPAAKAFRAAGRGRHCGGRSLLAR